MNIKFKYLAERPEAVPLVAKWLYNEFGYLIPGKSLEFIIESVTARLNVNKIPLSIVAITDNEIIGTVSLKATDMDIRNNYSPWLDALYVDKKYRKN